MVEECKKSVYVVIEWPPTFREQNTFFPETFFAYPISEQKITVWVSVTQQQKLHLFSSLLESGIQAKKTDIQL